MRTLDTAERLPETGSIKRASIPRALKILLTVFSLFIVITSATISARAVSVETLLGGGDPETIKIIALLTVITIIPMLLIMLTGFTRIVIVLSIVRNAIGLQNMPPNTVIIGLALFITFFVMNPVINQMNNVAYEPYVNGQMTLEESVQKAKGPLRDFMLKQTYKTDIAFFGNLAGINDVSDLNSVPDRVVITSFVTSELKHAFAIGFFIYIPFIVIDMVVSSTLMAMGMMMLPPSMISMPFKILLFVLVDGWQLTIGTLIKSFAA